MKYDLKASAKIYFGIFGLLILLGIGTGIMARTSGTYLRGSELVIGSNMFATMMLVMFMAVFGVFVLIIGKGLYDFQMNLFKGEGYLMHTLPVSAWQLVTSKMLTMILWLLIDVVVSFVTLYLSFATGGFGASFMDALKSAVGLLDMQLIWSGGYAVLYILAVISVSYLVSAITSMQGKYNRFGGVLMAIFVIGFPRIAAKYMLVAGIGVLVVSYALTIWLISKHLNLE